MRCFHQSRRQLVRNLAIQHYGSAKTRNDMIMIIRNHVVDLIGASAGTVDDDPALVRLAAGFYFKPVRTVLAKMLFDGGHFCFLLKLHAVMVCVFR